MRERLASLRGAKATKQSLEVILGLLRGACPERDSSVAPLPQNNKKRRTQSDNSFREITNGKG